MTGLPKNERVWVTYFDASGNARFILTSKPARDVYSLYEVTEDGLKKRGKSPSPGELEETYNIREAVGAAD